MPTEAPQDETTPTPISPALKAVAWIMLVVPILGTGAHILLLAMADDPQWKEWLRAYSHGPVMITVVLLAFANLVGSWLHYRHTGMAKSVVARILTYCWIVSLVFIWRANV
jgi:hypothetical protein